MIDKDFFWASYNRNAVQKIEKLIAQKKQQRQDFAIVDLHLHSNYSTDANQHFWDILHNTKKYGFEIISITDHDDVRVYDEIFHAITGNQIDLDSFPILLTGIEHTVSFPEYGGMCHILKHFINPMSYNIRRDITILENSYFTRAHIQIERLYQSKAIQQLFKKNISDITEFDFLKYLQEKNIRLPDYIPLVEYLSLKLKKFRLSYKRLFEYLKRFNQEDPCSVRRNIKDKRFKLLEKKYEGMNVEGNNRFLLSILAVRDVDDANYANFPASGNLSVNEYGQPNILQLNSDGITSFAHPTEQKINAVSTLCQIKKDIFALEDNYRNPYHDKILLTKTAQNLNLPIIKGSDSHSISDDFYKNMEFYKMPITDLEKFVNSTKI